MQRTAFQFSLSELLALPALLVAGVGVAWGTDDLALRIGLGQTIWLSSWIPLPLRWQAHVILILFDLPGILLLTPLTFGLGFLPYRWATITCFCLVASHPVANCIYLGLDDYLYVYGWTTSVLLVIPVTSWLMGKLMKRRWKLCKGTKWLAVAVSASLVTLCFYGFCDYAFDW